MNCKPGDLAVIVRSATGLEGTFVRCVKLWPSCSHDLDGRAVLGDIGPRWLLEKPIVNGEGDTLFTYADNRLRPIRDQPGEDEMLRIAGKPQDQREPA